MLASWVRRGLKGHDLRPHALCRAGGGVQCPALHSGEVEVPVQVLHPTRRSIKRTPQQLALLHTLQGRVPGNAASRAAWP